jgi:integrase
MPERKNLTKRAIAALPMPKSGRAIYWDTHNQHLCLRITAAGHRAWYWYGKVRGRPTKVKLGDVATLPPERAREMAAKMDLARVAGKDPAEERRARKAEPTLQELFDRWLEMHAKPRLRTWKESERVYKAFFGAWGYRRLSEIKGHHVATRHAEIGKANGNYAANRALSLLRLLYNKAERLVGWSGPNPAKGIGRFKENKRERFLDSEEVQALVAAIDQEPSLWRTYFTCALWTGQRESSLSTMRWQDLHLEQGLWIIPADFSKNDRFIPVALLPPAVETLRALQAISNGSPWVFAADNETGHIREVNRAWRRVKNRAVINDPAVIPYTLRHTVASQLGMAGTSQAIIAAALGHADIATSARYTHLNTDPVRAALVGVNAKLLGVTSKEETADNGTQKN